MAPMDANDANASGANANGANNASGANDANDASGASDTTVRRRGSSLRRGKQRQSRLSASSLS